MLYEVLYAVIDIVVAIGEWVMSWPITSQYALVPGFLFIGMLIVVSKAWRA